MQCPGSGGGTNGTAQHMLGAARFSETLGVGSCLVGDWLTSADMRCSSPFHRCPNLKFEALVVRNWVAHDAEPIQQGAAAQHQPFAS